MRMKEEIQGNTLSVSNGEKWRKSVTQTGRDSRTEDVSMRRCFFPLRSEERHDPNEIWLIGREYLLLVSNVLEHQASSNRNISVFERRSDGNYPAHSLIAPSRRKPKEEGKHSRGCHRSAICSLFIRSLFLSSSSSLYNTQFVP